MIERKMIASEVEFRKNFERHVKENANIVEWTPENVMKLIEGCRETFGIPHFMTGYAGMDFEFGGKKAVLFKCVGGAGKEMTSLVVGVPNDVFSEMKERSGDWHFLAIRYNPVKYEELVKLPVIL